MSRYFVGHRHPPSKQGKVKAEKITTQDLNYINHHQSSASEVKIK
jgi:hypothetical protein